MKKFFTNPWVITFGIIITAIIIIGVKKGWWKSGRSYCQCTHTSGQCGRDQYCDGCNCVYEPNRIAQNIPVIINPILPAPPPPPKPIPAS